MHLFVLMLSFCTNALAWDHHQALMERIFDSQFGKSRIFLFEKIKMPSPDEEAKELRQIAVDLHLNVQKIPKIVATFPKEVLINNLLTSPIIDEPDLGMDQDLDDAADPQNDRAWMGGTSGPTSQGFRHMYFLGLDFKSPLSTLQIPFRSLGQSRERIALLQAEAKKYFEQGKIFWGLRLLTWSAHYIQDLHQPFHVLQIPSLHMLPYKKLFAAFVKSSTHAIGNYHYAYEGLVREMTKDANQLQNCFEMPLPVGVALQENGFIQLSRKLGARVGPLVYELFGDRMKDDEVDLPSGIGESDYFALAHMNEPKNLASEELKGLARTDELALRRNMQQFETLLELRRDTCTLMRSLSGYTIAVYDSFESSIRTGK